MLTADNGQPGNGKHQAGVVEVHHVLGDHLPVDCSLKRVGEQADDVLLNLKLFRCLDVHHAGDVGKLKLGKKSVEYFEIFVYFLRVVRSW